MIEVTITHVAAPGRLALLARTIDSFARMLLGRQADRCIVSIDPAPDGHGDVAGALAILRPRFRQVVHSAPRRASFADAVRWCWETSTADRVFHLEDDWVLTCPIRLAAMESVLDADPSLSAVNLRAYGRFKPVGQPYLSPGLWRGSACRRLAAGIVDGINPERQLWDLAKASGDRAAYWPDRAVVRDIGREWLAGSGYRKDAEGCNKWKGWVKA